MKVRPYVGCLWAVLALATPGFPQSGKSRLTETDLFRFNWIADARISPDGSRVAFVKIWVNQKADRYESALWIVPASGSEPARQLTAGPRDTGLPMASGSPLCAASR
jgi:dipeptidyl aminopeptidase/acylaminoacyl peptidase